MEPSAASIRQTSIGLPFDSEAHYQACVEDLSLYRQHIEAIRIQHLELFPQAIELGYSFHSKYWSIKQQILLRRIKVKTTGRVCLIRPSFVLPYMVARTDQLEKPLRLRQYGVPFEELAYQAGRNHQFYYRAWASLGRVSLVGTTVKDPETLPPHLIADEKHTWLQGQKVYIPTTVAAGCILGASVVTDASADALEKGYGEFAQEARQLKPDYQPQTVCTDGWKGTRQAWQRLFQAITLILCFLHSVLKIHDRCRGALRQFLLDQAWRAYEATTKSQFAQRLRRLREWVEANLDPGDLKDTVLKLCQQKPQFMGAYDAPAAARTSNAVDRVLNVLDRVLYAMRYFHGTQISARLGVRAMALQWNFHPYGQRTQRSGPTRSSPFADLNGFQYHPNWLHNLLIASSMGGRRL